MRKSKVRESLLALLAAACVVLVSAAISFFTNVSSYYIASALVLPIILLLRREADAFLMILFTALLAIGMHEVIYFTPILLSLIMLLTPICVDMRTGATLAETLSKLGFKGGIVRAFLFAVVSMLPALVLVFLLSQVAYYLGFDDAHKVDQKITALPPYILLYAVTVGPLAEEVFFRSFLTRYVGPIPANIIFAFAHLSYGSVYEIVGAFGLGIFLYLLFKISGDLKSPIFAHMMINAGSLYMIKYMQF
ncbi:MAG: CPBP family intramembrane glutamic endopeptidase [Candidatus Micrarchaeia archaeon]